MEAKELPPRPNLEQYKKQAKELLKECRAGAAAAINRVKQQRPAGNRGTEITLVDAQFTLAREFGFESWPKFAKHVEAVNRERMVTALEDPRGAFIRAACVPREWHASGTLEDAEAILKTYPNVRSSDIHTAAILGDEKEVRRHLAADTMNAAAKGGPYGWDALTHLCFSRYLRINRERSPEFVRTAKALLDAGADANTGWMENDHEPRGTWESAIYGAAGIARDGELTRLLLERGADPNDNETAYHASETHDNSALKVLVESGKLNEEALLTILLRKTDWHDFEGVKWMLERGVDPNRMTGWGKTAMHNAILSDNSMEIFEVLLEHGADPAIIAERSERLPQVAPPRSGVAMAARRGRSDLLELFERHGIPVELKGVDGLIAACARDNGGRIREIAAKKPQLVQELLAEGGRLVVQFAGVGNTKGVAHLIGIGVAVDARFEEGDGYFDIAKHSTALHAAAWRLWPKTVKLLLERGATVDAKDGKGRTPLQLAVRACVDSYWAERRTAEAARLLLEAGADARVVEYPTGYAEADELLRAHGVVSR